VKHGIFQHVQGKRNLVSSSGHVMFYYDINKYQWNTKPFLFCCERCDLLSYHSSGDLFTWEDNMLFPLVKVCFRAKAHFVLCNNTIEFMFLGINMFWARLRLILARAVRRGLNEPEKGPKHIYAKENNLLNLYYYYDHFGGHWENNNWKKWQQNSLNNHASIYKLNGFYFPSMKIHNT